MLAPPGEPPPVSAAEIAAHEAYYRARVATEIDQRAPTSIDQQRYEIARAKAAAQAREIQVRFPTIEASAAFRYGHIARKPSYGHAGPEVGLTVRFDEHFAFEIPVALMQTWTGDLGHWATIATSPAFVVSFKEGDTLVYARGGPDLLIPRGASGMAPNAMIGGHLGVGFVAFVASLPNYGYVGLGLDLRAAVRGGVGGPDSALDAPNLGLDGLFVLRLAY